LKCTFQGADLADAEFNPSPLWTMINLDRCRFDIDPDSGRVTSFARAKLTRVTANNSRGQHAGDFSDADFTDAVFAEADFGTRSKDPSQGRGAFMRRANFTRTTLSGTSFVQADLGEAHFVDLTADKLANLDLRFAKLG